MNLNQPKTDDGHHTQSVNGQPINEATPSLGNIAALGHESRQALQASAAYGQYPSGGSGKISAPAAPQPERWANIPQDLRELPHWSVADEQKAPRVPAQGQRYAKSNDFSTWSSFDQTASWAAHKQLHIGFFLHESDPFTCIDLDVKDSTSPDEQARYQRIIDSFDSYTERSRSGKGYHIWVRGKVGQGARRDGVEVYSQERFIICTGNVVVDKPIAHRQEMLNILLSEIRNAQGAHQQGVALVELPQEEDDKEVWERAVNASNGAKFHDLWMGNSQDYPELKSQSEADLSLISMLCFYSPSNTQVRRMFRMSALGQRDKAQRQDYLDRSIAKAREHRPEDSCVQHGKQVALALMATELFKRMTKQRVTHMTPTNALRLVTADEIAARPPMKWLVRGVLPEKGIGAIFGQPGSGKSFLVLDLLASIAGGFLWFGVPTKTAPVVYITLEGQAGMPQRIRAHTAAKGLLDRIVFIEQPIDLRRTDTLQEIVGLIRNAGLDGGVVCIDTLAASAPGMDENTSADMGQLIANLQELQTQLGGFVLVVHHSGKDETKGLRGWSGLNGALDCAIAVSRVSEDKRDMGRRWEVTKSKDGSDGVRNEFELQPVHLGWDEEGYPLNSCIVSPRIFDDAGQADRDKHIDDFIWNWISGQAEQGHRPSGRSLEAQRNQMQSSVKITQSQLRDSVARLKAAGRVVVQPEKGNPWLRAVDIEADASAVQGAYNAPSGVLGAINAP